MLGEKVHYNPVGGDGAVGKKDRMEDLKLPDIGNSSRNGEYEMGQSTLDKREAQEDKEKKASPRRDGAAPA